ncbi:DMT family transporter [Aegicerativicinus sediminis]|uniref:DMT family transporter n=1 Tax=Aegicerativicinus sediminis TaxID=2893202 RepID=UPI001E3DD4DE|nr:DMT family transporter [Aegicerativicinus sediminis]
MNNKAIVYMIFSAFAFTFLNVGVKYLESLSVNQIIFFRSLGTLFFTVPLIIKNRLPFFGNQKGLLLFRSAVGLTSMFFFFSALKYITVGTAVSLRYISPIFAAIFAIFLLKEKVKLLQWFCFLIAFGGVVVLRKFELDMDYTGLIMGLCSAFFAGLVYISIHMIGNRDHPVVVVNFFMLVSTIVGGIFTISNWTTPSVQEWLVLASLGISGYLAQLFMTKAFQIGETNVIAPLKYIEVVFSIILGVLWFGEIYSFITLLGIGLIIIGLAGNIYLKRKPKNS